MSDNEQQAAAQEQQQQLLAQIRREIAALDILHELLLEHFLIAQLPHDARRGRQPHPARGR